MQRVFYLEMIHMKICIGVSVGKDISESTQAGDQESSHVNGSPKYQNILSKIKVP